MIERPQIREFTLKSKREVAQGTTEVSFDVGDKDFAFIAGQYIRLTIPSLSSDVPKGNTRDFTIASSPEIKDTVVIAFRNSESAFKKALVDAPLGTPVKIQGPLGAFLLPDDATVPVVYIAGGIGVTPALSMIRFISDRGVGQPIQVVYGNSSPERAAYIEEMRAISKNHPNIKLIEKIGEIDTQFIFEIVEYTSSTLWYLCGAPEMTISLSQKITEDLGVRAENIRTEEYPGYKTGGGEYKIPAPDVGSEVALTKEDIYADKNLVRTLFEVAGQASLIAVTDAQGTIIYVSDKFIEVSKYSKEELIGQNHRILKSGFHPPEFYEELWKTISSGKRWSGEVKNRAKDGTFYWVDTIIAPVVNNGKIERYFALRLLITDKKELENAKMLALSVLKNIQEEKNKAEEATKRLKIATETARIGVLELDLTTNTIKIDTTTRALYGLPKEEIALDFKQWLSFVHPDDVKKVTEKVSQAIEGNLPFEDIFRIVLPTGKVRYMNSYAKVERNAENKPIRMIGVNFDITKEKEIDREKTEFVSLASHQLKTPVGAISWNLEMLKTGDYGPLNEQQQEVVSEMYTMNQRMIELINGLLNISRIELGVFIIEPTPTNFVAICEEVLNEMEPRLISKGHHLTKRYDENLTEVNADSKLLRIVFQNLISNAIKYTPDRGEVGVAIEVEDGEVLITVSNNGAAIPEADKPRIFTKLFRASNAQEQDPHGNGLGLYLVKEIVMNAGGRIWFDSIAGKGTTFYVSFPLSGMLKKEGTKELAP